MPVAQHVWSEYPIPTGERTDGALPTEFGAGPEFAAMQQDHGITVAGFQISGDEPVHDDGLPLELHGSQR